MYFKSDNFCKQRRTARGRGAVSQSSYAHRHKSMSAQPSPAPVTRVATYLTINCLIMCRFQRARAVRRPMNYDCRLVVIDLMRTFFRVRPSRIPGNLIMENSPGRVSGIFPKSGIYREHYTYF